MRFRRTWTYSAGAAVLGMCIVITILSGRSQPESLSGSSAPPDSVTIPDPAVIEQDAYGIQISRLDVVERRIRRNETFAEILTAYNVPYAEVVTVAHTARPQFDVRSMRAGAPIRLYHDSLDTARYFVYKRDAVNYVVFDFTSDSARVYEGMREVVVERKHLAGSINESLYATLEEQDLSSNLVPLLATSLSEVFAWQVDFFRIQKGDEFSVLYEERSIDGEPIGIGRIVAARFQHRAENYMGFYFDRGERADFYDEDGNSLRKVLLKAPLKFDRISSRYTKRRFHPVQRRWKSHLGTDYAADPGTPIHTVGDGEVLEARYSRYNGNYVKIRHNSTYTTGYLHMSRIANGIRPGTHVVQGEVIGYVGSTGLATGPHLCYRYWKHGVQIDPFKDDIPPAHPVDPDLKEEFFAVRDSLMPLLFNPRSPQFAQWSAPRPSDPVL